MAFDLSKLDIIGAAEKGFTFNILDITGEETEAKIKVLGVASKTGKIANLKYEQAAEKIRKEFGITAKQLEKPENIDPEKYFDYIAAIDAAYCKHVLTPLTVSIEGIEMSGKPLEITPEVIEELYTKLPLLALQVGQQIRDVKASLQSF